VPLHGANRLPKKVKFILLTFGQKYLRVQRHTMPEDGLLNQNELDQYRQRKSSVVNAEIVQEV
jgi:hypothetical protein